MKKAIVISCFNWYEKRIKPVRELLIEKGYDVIILIADFDHIKKQSVSPKFEECTYVKVPQYKKNLSINRIRSHLLFDKKCAAIIDEIKPELIYCQVPPNKVAYYCAKYKEQHNYVKLIIDVIDLWPESMPLGRVRNTLPAKKWRNWRDYALSQADHVFTECDLYQDKLKYVLTPSKTSSLYLYKEQTPEEIELVNSIVNNLKPFKETIKFAYVGSMNNIIDIDGICSIISKVHSYGYHCELHAIGTGESQVQFEEAIKHTGCESHFYGAIYDEIEKIKILAPCDYGFNMMKGDISVGLTIKSIDYFSYGLPIINNINGDTMNMINSSNVGINFNSHSFELNMINHQDVIFFYENTFSKVRFIDTVNCSLNELRI